MTAKETTVVAPHLPVRLDSSPWPSTALAAPRIQRVTLMLTEICNLDCWMCDFAKSKKLTKVMPLSPEQVVQTLSHPLLRTSLRSLTFTGGEPFAYPRLRELYAAIRTAFPRLGIHFSTNGTLLPKMLPVLDLIDNWKNVSLFMSVDGITKHDQQRGVEGAFDKTVATLQSLRERYPRLPITLKFTITPVNYDELAATYRYFTSRGFRFTAKMLENNKNYTNKLSPIATDFTPEQIESISSQLHNILAADPRPAHDKRRREMEEVLDSLTAGWARSGRCATPTNGLFIDAGLNVFTCKEYPPVLNLSEQTLDALGQTHAYNHVVRCEQTNVELCTHCTSQMKQVKVESIWKRYLGS